MIIIEIFRLFGTINLNGLSGAQSDLNNLDNRARNSGRTLDSLGRLGTKMGGLVAKGAAAAGAAMTVMKGIIGKTGVDYNAMMEQSEVAWATLLGTQEDAKKMLKDISDFTKATPFETEQVDMMAKYMHNAGLAGKELFDELLKVSDVSSAFAIPAAEAKELTRQMSQVRQAGVAYTEDLNVLQDRGIPIYKAIADQVGINVAEVKKMASDGKLSSEIYLAAFDNIAKGVKGASEDQSKTFNGMISTMKDSLKILAGKLAEPIFDKMKDGMEKLLPLIDGFTELAKGNIGGFSEIVTKAFGQETGLKIMTFVFAVQDGMAKVKEYIEIGKDAIKALFEAFKGNEGAAVSIMTRLGLDREQVQMVLTIVESIKSYVKNLIEYWTNAFGGAKDAVSSLIDWLGPYVMPIVNEVFGFIKEQLGILQAFWKENGDQIILAVQNAFNFIMSIVQFVMPAVLFIIQTVWENIKGVISGALDIIMGLIKVFTGIFTGDFSMMWEGVKQLFFGALEFLWNLINLMLIGKLIGGIKAFATKGIELFKGFLDNGVNIFKNLDDHVFRIVGNLVSKAVSKFKGFVDEGVRIFNTLKTFGANTFEALKQAIISVAQKIYTGVIDKFSSMATKAKYWFDEIVSGAKSKFNSVKNAIVNPINTAKDLVRTAVDNIKGIFSGLSLSLPNIKTPHFSLKNWSINPKDWLKAMPSIGIDWYAKGTNFAPGGLAMVGERGPELIQLPRGSKVKTNEETKQMMEQRPSQNITYITVEGNIDRDLYEDIMSEQDTRLNTKLAFSGVKGR